MNGVLLSSKTSISIAAVCKASTSAAIGVSP